MTVSLVDLIAKRDELERQIREARNSDRAEAIARIRQLMAENGLTVADLSVASKPKEERAKVAPKYRDPSTGASWTGRGLKPKWLVAAIEAGKSLSDFAI